MMKLRPIFRVIVFVPVDSVESLRRAIHRAELLVYGNYKNVMWESTPGSEHFTPLLGATPSVGEVDKEAIVPSIQLIMSIERENSQLEKLVTTIRNAHPWEEPAIYIDETYAVASSTS